MYWYDLSIILAIVFSGVMRLSVKVWFADPYPLKNEI
jgi:hypothetical protein